jgi:hypothetical protein
LLGKHSTTWAILPAPIFFSTAKIHRRKELNLLLPSTLNMSKNVMLIQKF